MHTVKKSQLDYFRIIIVIAIFTNVLLTLSFNLVNKRLFLAVMYLCGQQMSLYSLFYFFGKAKNLS